MLFIYKTKRNANITTTIKTKIVIVPIVDDLDRCITDGRNVKVLEAMQLILSVPGAPILSFLAVHEAGSKWYYVVFFLASCPSLCYFWRSLLRYKKEYIL